MRKQITLFQDQYELFKELKSEKLLVAFVEFMFEDKQPKNNQLNSLETAIFNSFIDRMEKSKKMYDRNSKGGQSSNGGGRPKTAVEKPIEKTAKEQPKEQPKNKEEEVEDNIFISKDINVESTEFHYGLRDYETLYESYPFKSKGIDKQVCNKLIEKQLKQGATINGMLKEMKLEGLELRINQGLSYRYGKKFETWIKEYVEGMANNEDRLKKLLVEHRKRLENGPSYKKNPRDEICDLYGTDYVKKLFMETKQGVRLFTT